MTQLKENSVKENPVKEDLLGEGQAEASKDPLDRLWRAVGDDATDFNF